MTSPSWDPANPEQTPPMQPSPPPVSGEIVPAIGGYAPHVPYPSDPVLFTIGDIGVTRAQVIVPAGRFPLRGTVWTTQDSTQVTQGVSTTGVVLTVVSMALLCMCGLLLWPLLIFVPFGLLFLLIRDRKVSGFISVTVSGPGLFHAVQLPPGPEVSAMVAYQVNQARALAAVA